LVAETNDLNEEPQEPGVLPPRQERTVRSVPTVPEVAKALARPAERVRFMGDDDLDLHHTFGTLAVRRVEVPAVQAWMGHADIQTTMHCVHHRDRGGEAKLLAEAFRIGALQRVGSEAHSD
jgi:integrase